MDPDRVLPPEAFTNTTGAVPMDAELPNGPDYVKETFRLLVRELDRKQGMIDDLKQIAEAGFGLNPEDCELLEQTMTDRDHLKAATDAMAAYFY